MTAVTRAFLRQGSLAVAAVLAIVGLLASFHHVVQGGVRRGDVWRHATALHGMAATRCSALGGWTARESCLVELNASLRDGPSPRDIAAAMGQRAE
jgi:hypothetical protein